MVLGSTPAVALGEGEPVVLGEATKTEDDAQELGEVILEEDAADQSLYEELDEAELPELSDSADVEATASEPDDAPFELSIPAEEIDFSVPEDPIDVTIDDYVSWCFEREVPGYGEDELATQSHLTGKEAVAYGCLSTQIAEVAAGKRTSTVFEIPVELLLGRTEFRGKDLGMGAITIDNYSQAFEKVQNALNFDMVAVYNALRSDNPYDLYWEDMSQSIRISGVSFGVRNEGDELVIVVEDQAYTYSLPVSKAYAKSDFEVNSSKINRAQKALATAKKIVSDSKGRNAYDRLKYFKDKICDLVSYNYAAQSSRPSNSESPYSDPWEMVYVFDGDPSTKTVCEGYSKAFAYLCALANIDGVDCRLISGSNKSSIGGGGAHAWDIVTMPDGRNYLVDVTWCDGENSIGGPNYLFLAAPKSGSVKGSYTFLVAHDITVAYTYNDKMYDLYTTTELTLSSMPYGTKTSGSNIGGATVSVAKATYTGAELRPSLTVKMGGKTLKDGTDYTVVWQNNINAGTGKAILSGKGSYSGGKTVAFAISPRQISGAKVDKIPDQKYWGSAVKPGAMVTDRGVTLVSGRDYTLSWANNNKVGTAKVTITGKGNYAGSKTVSFRIVKPKPGDIRTFPDVPKSHWAYQVVGQAGALGLIGGYSNGNFGPEDNITRGQVAVILWNMAGNPAAGKGAKNFSDVKSGAYYYSAVRWASSIGVVSGYSGGKFGPNDLVTREQLAVMLSNYASKVGGLKVVGSKADFGKMTDAGKVSGYAVKAVGWCFKNKILSGSGNKVMPQGNATRAQAAKMVVFLRDML